MSGHVASRADSELVPPGHDTSLRSGRDGACEGRGAQAREPSERAEDRRRLGRVDASGAVQWAGPRGAFAVGAECTATPIRYSNAPTVSQKFGALSASS
jgi:hypothetical protein